MAPRSDATSQRRETPQFRLQPLMQDALGQVARQQDAGAGDEPAGLGETAMRGDEVTPRNAVAVEKDDVGAGTGADAAVADLGEAKAAVLVPDMLDRDDLPCRPSRAPRAAVAGPEPSSATTISKLRSDWRDSARSTTSSASSRL